MRKVRLADGREITLPALGHIEQSHELSDPQPLVYKLVFARKAESVELQDYFAAIYLTDREVLLPFWRSKRELDLFVRECCGIADQVRDPSSEWQAGSIFLQYSPSLITILNDAAKLALAEAGSAASRPKMELRHVMSALAAHPELEFTRQAFKFGMRRQSLPRSKRKP